MYSDLPTGYFDMLVDLTINVMKDQPTDFLEYAATYFQRIYELAGDSEFFESQIDHGEAFEDMKSVLAIIDEEKEEIRTKPKANFRRKSVAAERINIDDLEDEEDMYKIIPKTDDQRVKLKAACEQILLFKNLDDEQMSHIIDAMFEVVVKPNDQIIAQDDDGDNFYVIQDGTFDCFINDENGEEKLIYTYKNEGYFGELALMYNAPRSATVRAETSGILWAMDRQTFRNLVVVQSAQKKRIYDNFLKGFPIFNEVTATERMNVADALIPKDFNIDDIIIKQGKPGHEMYFIESGEVSIRRTQNGKEVELVQLKSGNYFGELALLSNQARQASAVALGPVKVAMLEIKTFERLMGPCLEIMKRNAADYQKQLAEIFGEL